MQIKVKVKLSSAIYLNACITKTARNTQFYPIEEVTTSFQNREQYETRLPVQVT